MNALVLAFALASAHAAPDVGKPAPAFSLPAQDGRTVKLSSLRGKWVVLEWFNTGCSAVREHYDSKGMQDLQRKYAEKGVVWYAVVSSRPGKQGHLTAEEAQETLKSEGMAAGILLDPKGTVGRLYGAKTTPHMFVIDPEGVLVFMGGIDDKPSAHAETGARNHVAAALDEGMAGKDVSVPTTKPYGCSVKY